MKRLLVSAFMALTMILIPFAGVAAFIGFMFAVMTHPVVTLGLTTFGVFTYFWYDAYNYLD